MLKYNLSIFGDFQTERNEYLGIFTNFHRNNSIFIVDILSICVVHTFHNLRWYILLSIYFVIISTINSEMSLFSRKNNENVSNINFILSLRIVCLVLGHLPESKPPNGRSPKQNTPATRWLFDLDRVLSRTKHRVHFMTFNEVFLRVNDTREVYTEWMLISA